MAAAVCAFVLLALLLESGGLLDWARRLELGPERTVALPAATWLAQSLDNLGVAQLRRKTLVELARIGWSDDPAALAEARPKPAAVETSHASTTAPAAPLPAPAAAAQPAPTPAQPTIPGTALPPRSTQLPELAPLPAGKTRTVALAGDSMMAVGLSATILRQAPQYKNLTLVKAFKSGTGLARPEVFDWQAEYPAMLAGVKPDVVVVAIGANDGQGFVDAGITYPFGTKGWQAVYQARVQAYLTMLEADGATVVWLGLPPMKSDTYDAHIALVNQIDYAVVSASPHAIWFSTTGFYGDPGGHFAEYGTVHGATVRLRQGDGIHISDEGGVLVADKLLPWLDGRAPR